MLHRNAAQPLLDSTTLQDISNTVAHGKASDALLSADKANQDSGTPRDDLPKEALVTATEDRPLESTNPQDAPPQPTSTDPVLALPTPAQPPEQGISGVAHVADVTQGPVDRILDQVTNAISTTQDDHRPDQDHELQAFDATAQAQDAQGDTNGEEDLLEAADTTPAGPAPLDHERPTILAVFLDSGMPRRCPWYASCHMDFPKTGKRGDIELHLRDHHKEDIAPADGHCLLMKEHKFRGQVTMVSCGSPYSDLRTYARHLLSKSHSVTGAVHVCSVCGLPSGRRDSAVRHMKDVHHIILADQPTGA